MGLPVVTFEVFLEQYFTDKLNNMPKIQDDIPIRVASISFGFDNHKLIHLLTHRGTLVTEGKLEKLPEINN
jgi:hypothetical protein